MIKEFKIGGITYKIIYVKEIDDGSLGICSQVTKTIKIALNHNGRSIDDEGLGQTLYHEVLHAILGELAQDDLNNDEKFVQSLSLLLHQFEETKK